jgi:hypothetical protein
MFIAPEVAWRLAIIIWRSSNDKPELVKQRMRQASRMFRRMAQRGWECPDDPWVRSPPWPPALAIRMMTGRWPPEKPQAEP